MRLLARRRRPKSPPRTDYERFRGIVDYPPMPLRGAPVMDTPALADFDRLCLHWITPPLRRGSGGADNIMRVVRYLADQGHRNAIWVYDTWKVVKASPAWLRDWCKEAVAGYETVDIEINPLPNDLDQLRGDAVIATDHISAYPARAVQHVSRRFYFIQDNEALFSATGYGSIFAERTYDFGFDALSNGPWLHAFSVGHGMWSMQWDQAADPTTYFVSDESRKRGHIAFYARSETPRRVVELGLLTFDLLAQWGVSFHVDFFGGESFGDLLYPHTVHGFLTPAELGNLYRSVELGMVFSATNRSIVPREMMACGLPVIEIATNSTRDFSSEKGAVFCGENPSDIAVALCLLLNDERRRKQLSIAGAAHARTFSWDASARAIEEALLTRTALQRPSRGGLDPAQATSA